MDISKISLNIKEGTADKPFVLSDREVLTLYKLATSANPNIKIRGYVTTDTGNIERFRSFTIKQAFSDLHILAKEVQSQDWNVTAMTSNIYEGGSTELIATGISLSTLRYEVIVDSLQVNVGSYTESNLSSNLVVDLAAGRISYNPATFNSGWLATVRVKFWPMFVEEPTDDDFRYVTLNIRAIAVTGIDCNVPSSINVGSTSILSASVLPENHTKKHGVRYGFSSDLGSVTPVGPVEVGQTTFFAPDNSCDVTFGFMVYMFGNEQASFIKTVSSKVTKLTVGVSVAQHNLNEGHSTIVITQGYTFAEFQRRLSVRDISGDITEEEILGRVEVSDSGIVSLAAASDNSTWSGRLCMEFVAPGDSFDHPRELLECDINLHAVGISRVSTNINQLGQYYSNRVVCSEFPNNHTKGNITFALKSNTTGIAITGNSPTFTVTSTNVGAGELTASAFIGATKLAETTIPVETLSLDFTVSIDAESVAEGGTIAVTSVGLDESQLQCRISAEIISSDNLDLTPEDISSRVRYEGNKICVSNANKNDEWMARVSVTFIAKYATWDNVPHIQNVAFDVVAHKVTAIRVDSGEEMQDFVTLNMAIPMNVIMLPQHNTKANGYKDYSAVTSSGSVLSPNASPGTYTFITSTIGKYIINASAKVFDETFECEKCVTSYRGGVSRRYAYGKWNGFDDLSPESEETIGDRMWLMEWVPYLIDMSPVKGEEAKVPVGELMKTNWLRFVDGRFAPTVGITEEQRAQCDVALYLDADKSHKYCDAGGYDAEAFYNEYGMSQKLYNDNGEEVRILRPWETTDTKYSIFVGRREDVYLIDNVETEDGMIIKGIAIDKVSIEGSDNHKNYPLARTAICPGLITTVGNKARCFFYDYCPGDTNTIGGAGLNGQDFFRNDGAYPRVNDVNCDTNARYARANNANTNASYPVAEGGYHARNVWMTCAEVAFGTKYLHDIKLFGPGMSANLTCNNEQTYLLNGGGRARVHGSSNDWQYTNFGGGFSILKTNASGGGSTLYGSPFSGTYQRMRSLEAQMAVSMAVELGVEENVEFEFYGRTYRYQCPSGAESLNDGYMNVRLYAMRSFLVHAYNSSGAAEDFDVEMCLLNSIVFGKSLCGEIWEYTQGGYEMVQQNSGTTNIGTKVYLECDQKKWWKPTSTVQGANVRWDFEDTYSHIATVQEANFSSGYVKERVPYTNMRKVLGGSISTGECFYTYESRLSSAANYRVRPYVVFGGYLFNTACSARATTSSINASYTTFAIGGSAQVLLA